VVSCHMSNLVRLVCATLLAALSGCTGGDYVGHIAMAGQEAETQTFTGPDAKSFCEQFIATSQAEVAKKPSTEGWVYALNPDGETVMIAKEDSNRAIAQGFKPATEEGIRKYLETKEAARNWKIANFRGWCTRK
jgi:hypothetical protein